MTQAEKIFQYAKKPWLITVYTLIVVLVYYFADKSVATYFHNLDFRTHFQALTYVSILGKWKIYVAAFLLAGLYFRFVQKNKQYETRFWFLFASVLIPNLIIFGLKILVSRARPDLLFEQQAYGFYWFKLEDMYWSCPSGHAVTATALAMSLGYLFPRYLMTYILFAILICFTRIGLAHHYLSDVLIGIYLSILTVGQFTHYVKSHRYFERIN